MADMLSRKQKIVCAIGIVVIFALLTYFSMPTERAVWKPTGNYNIAPDLAGIRETYPMGGDPLKPEKIEDEIGYGYLSLKMFKERYANDNITVKGRADGRVMYLGENTKFFTLQDNSPNMLMALSATGITEQSGKIYMLYERNGNIYIFVLILEILAWLFVYPVACFINERDVPEPGRVILSER